MRLVLDNGGSINVGPGGLVAGRASGCDLVLTDRRASSMHALFMTLGQRLCVRSLGRRLVQVNDQPADPQSWLSHDDRIELPGCALTVRGDVPLGTPWALEWADSALALGRTPVVVGSHNDPVEIPGWPDGAMRFTASASGLWLEPRVPCTIGGVRHDPGVVVAAQHGVELTIEGATVTVLAAASGQPPPTIPMAHPLTRLELAFHSSGGELLVAFGTRVCRVGLSELRASLMAVLLEPPAGVPPGHFVLDDEVIPRVWPRQKRGKLDLNTLVHRVRATLLREGIDPGLVIERARQGGGTRVVLGPDTRVAVH